jgi:vacuolar-type H+-ATPase subunit I/STV1
MKNIKYPLKATTFNQFKQRYILFTTIIGVILITLFFIRGFYLDLWQKLPFQNNYQILSFLLIIFYFLLSLYIYNIFKKNYSSKSDKK